MDNKQVAQVKLNFLERFLKNLFCFVGCTISLTDILVIQSNNRELGLGSLQAIGENTETPAP